MSSSRAVVHGPPTATGAKRAAPRAARLVDKARANKVRVKLSMLTATATATPIYYMATVEMPALTTVYHYLQVVINLLALLLNTQVVKYTLNLQVNILDFNPLVDNWVGHGGMPSRAIATVLRLSNLSLSSIITLV